MLGPVIEIRPRGAFELQESAEFGFGQREAAAYDGVMRLAFVLDGYREQLGVAVRQRPDGALECEPTGGDPEAVRAQVARILSVDVDARGWDELGRSDPLIGKLQAARPGLRPPLFHSAYEALVWSVLSARRPQRQMAELRDRLARAHGRVVTVAGQQLAVMPTPAELLAVREFPGLPEVKLRRMHGVARLAAEGGLDTAELRASPAAEAAARLRELEGIGPFYAELVTVRTLGHTDVLPSTETRVLELAGRLLGRRLDRAEFEQLAAPWSPWRTWAAVAIRAAGGKVLGDGSA